MGGKGSKPPLKQQKLNTSRPQSTWPVASTLSNRQRRRTIFDAARIVHLSCKMYTYIKVLPWHLLQLLVFSAVHWFLIWFLQVLLLWPQPQSEHVIGDSSRLRNSLCLRIRFTRGRPGWRPKGAGGFLDKIF